MTGRAHAATRRLRLFAAVAAAAIATLGDGLGASAAFTPTKSRSATRRPTALHGGVGDDRIDLIAPKHNRGYDRNDGGPNWVDQRTASSSSSVVPLMRLHACYLPGATDVQLNFIEPRMRRMCRSSPRFLVSFVPDDEDDDARRPPPAVCSRVGVMFELRSLTDEEDRGPLPKTVGVSNCELRPYRIRRVLNGRDHAHPVRFLEAEVEPLETAVEEDATAAEDGDEAEAAAAALAALTDIVALRHEIARTDAAAAELRAAADDDPVLRALPAAEAWVATLARDGDDCDARDANGDGDGDGDDSEDAAFWALAARWQDVCEWLSVQAVGCMRTEMNRIAMDYLCDQPGPLNLPIRFERDLPPDVAREVRQIETRWRDDIAAMDLEPNAPFQRLIELAPRGAARARALARMIEKERGRLRAKRALQGLFPDHFGY